MKRKNKSTAILVLVFLVGLSLLLYPTVSDYWNSKTQSRAITDYESVRDNLDETDYNAIFEQAALQITNKSCSVLSKFVLNK